MRQFHKSYLAILFVSCLVMTGSRASAITKAEIIVLAGQLRLSESDVIMAIEKDRTIFHLGTMDILDLKKGGVSEGIIRFMLKTPSLYGQTTDQPGPSNSQLQQNIPGSGLQDNQPTKQDNERFRPGSDEYSYQQYKPAAQARQLKLAVMEIQDVSRKLDAGAASRGTDYLRATINATKRFIVIDKSRQAEALTRMVVEQKKESYKECYDQSCQVPLGQALAADTLLRTQITMIGSFCTISSEMVDLAKEAAVGGGLQKFDCTEDGLGIAIEKLVPQIINN